MRRRGSRAEQKARNRQALLDAARRVFLRDGYHGASVEAIASAAGLTIGAVYSQFGGKPDLFLGLLECRVEERLEQIRGVVGGAGQDSIVAVARQWSRIVEEQLDWTLLVIEFRVTAARDPALNARFAELHERLLAGSVDAVVQAAGARGLEPPPRIADGMRAGMAIGPGFALARAVEGEAFTRDLLEEITTAVAARLLGDTATATADKPTKEGR